MKAASKSERPVMWVPRVERRIVGALRRFGADRRGAVALIFGFALVPIILAAGAALDYSVASSAKTSLDAAADAAVMAAVRRAAMGEKAADAEANARVLFEAAARKIPSLTLESAQVLVTDVDGTRTATVDYRARVPTRLVAIAGIKTIPVQGEAIGRAARPNYIDFHLLLDNTPSMGLGATTADIDKLVAATAGAAEDASCAFACHEKSKSGNDRYALARKIGVQMRIDMVRQATVKLIDTAGSTAAVPKQFRVGIHTFGTECSKQDTKLTTLRSLTDDLAAAKTDAAGIDLMPIKHQNFYNDQCTNSDEVLADMDKAIQSAGDGSSDKSPQKVLFIVTDGVTDAHYPSSCARPTVGGRCQEPMKIATYTALKARGVRVAVLYTTYLPLPTNGWYQTWIAPFAAKLPTQLQECASPGLFFEVSPSQGIPEAMVALFQKAVAQARLTR